MTRAIIGQFFGGKANAEYAQGGAPVSAMAHSLDVNLGGPATDLDGSTMKRNWVGPKGATAQLSIGHLKRGLYITLMAHGVFICSLGSAMMWSNLLGAN